MWLTGCLGVRFNWLYSVFDDLRSVLEFAVNLRCETGLCPADIQNHGHYCSKANTRDTAHTHIQPADTLDRWEHEQRDRERERNEQRMELDSGGGRKILNGCINFSVESTHTYCMLWPLFLSVASLCSWWKEIKMKTCRESSEVCKKQTCTLY